MTRISIALVAVIAFAVCACERQPIPGQTIVTHTHASNGHPRIEGEHHNEKADAPHAKPAEKNEAAVAPATPAPASPEQKPTFFPEKK